LPKDLSALIALAEDLGEDAVLLRSVMEVNDHQPERMVQLLHSRLGNLVDKKVAILGLAFKEGTDDVRESRSIPIIRALLGDGAHVAAYDPLAAVNMRQIFPDIEYCDSALEALRGADACLVMTEWQEFRNLDKEFDQMRTRIIIEGRQILSCKDREGICW